jgi:hypothetical protein
VAGLGPSECGVGERGTGLTVPFSIFLDSALARTGPLAGLSLPTDLPQSGPGRTRDMDLHGANLPAQIFFKPLIKSTITGQGLVDLTVSSSPTNRSRMLTSKPSWAALGYYCTR